MRNRVRTARSSVRAYITDNANEVSLPEEEGRGEAIIPTSGEDLLSSADTRADEAVQLGTDPQSGNELQSDAEPQLSDDSWLDDLVPYKPPVASESSNEPKDVKPAEGESENGTDDQQARLKQLYDSFEHIDEEVAKELDSKMLAPMRAELNELKVIRRQEQQARQTELLTKANTTIFSRYPEAERILHSQQFMDFVNSQNDPYATETEFDKLIKAYYAGDGDYVLRRLDKFVEGRGKPKPSVGVEPQHGSGGNTVGNVQKTKAKKMSESEYLAKRQAIRAAPRGTYPPNALKELALQYYSRED